MLYNRISRLFWHFMTSVFYRPRFLHIGKKTIIRKPLQLDDTTSISIADRVYISEYVWLMGNKDHRETLNIGDGTTIGHFGHIIAQNHVAIENDVMIADRVFISDCTHNYTDIDKPVMYQGVSDIGEVTIGEGSWIGENVCICGCRIGKHCVIGANSVVLRDIPDYCVAVGSPAVVVKRYDFDLNEWVSINNRIND